MTRMQEARNWIKATPYMEGGVSAGAALRDLLRDTVQEADDSYQRVCDERDTALARVALLESMIDANEYRRLDPEDYGSRGAIKRAGGVIDSTVKMRPTRFAVEVSDTAWEGRPLRECCRSYLEIILVNDEWVIRNNEHHSYVLHPDGRATTHNFARNGEMGNPAARGRWSTYAKAQEALVRHLAAGGKLS